MDFMRIDMKSVSMEMVQQLTRHLSDSAEFWLMQRHVNRIPIDEDSLFEEIQLALEKHFNYPDYQKYN